MAQPDRDFGEQEQGLEKGIKVRFTNPELLRAYILDAQKLPGATLAERISGIREVSLGEFPLDGQLFQSVKFTLIVEPDQDPRGQRPTAIIRTDLIFGKSDSNLKRSQLAIIQQPENAELANELFERIPFPEKDGLDLAQWDRTTARIYQSPLVKETLHEVPLVLLQIFDKDVGPGSISISLVSFSRHYDAYRALYDETERKKADGWEVDHFEISPWRFKQSVGIDVKDQDKFFKDLGFFEGVFLRLVNSLYQPEGMALPRVTIMLESPLILREEERVTFNDIGGQKDAVRVLKAAALLEKMGQVVGDLRKAKLLYGPPGNGKTSLAHAHQVN